MKRILSLLFAILMLTGILSLPVYAVDFNSVDTIKAVQEGLNNAGYNCGNADGIIGSNTRAQIAAFRSDVHIGDTSDIDGALLWALGLSDEPYWLPILSDEDAETVSAYLKDEYGEIIGPGFADIGANIQEMYDFGNYVQYNDSFEIGVRIISDNDSLLLATASYKDVWYLDSICNYDTGEYYYKDVNVFQDISVSQYNPASIQPSLILAGAADTRATDLPDTSYDQTYQEEQPQEPVSIGTEYVLNTNTKKFHYTWCSSAGDIKPSNRRDYVGTREEVISMGYDPCKRCNP